MLSECISLGPAVVADDIDEIVPDERWVEILEYVSVDVSESAVRAVFVTVVERSQYPALEIWSWVGSGDGVKRLRGQRVTIDTQHVGLHTGGDQRDLRIEEFGHVGCGAQRDAQPDLPGVSFADTVIEQEVARRVGAVDLKTQHGRAVGLGEPDIVKHGPGVEQF